MMIEVHTWQVITFFITLLLTLIGMGMGLTKTILTQFSDKLDARFNDTDHTREQQFKSLEMRLNALEPRFTELDKRVTKAKEDAAAANQKAHELELKMSNEYQRREDAVRSEVTNAARYDAINAKLDRVILSTTVIKN